MVVQQRNAALHQIEELIRLIELQSMHLTRPTLLLLVRALCVSITRFSALFTSRTKASCCFTISMYYCSLPLSIPTSFLVRS